MDVACKLLACKTPRRQDTESEESASRAQDREDPVDLTYQIVTGFELSTMVKQSAAGYDQRIMLYQNCAI